MQTSAEALDYALSLAPDANVQDAKGETPLHLALDGGYHPQLEAMLRVLRALGARADIANKRGKTAVQLAESGLTTVRTVFEHVFAAGPSPGPATSHN